MTQEPSQHRDSVPRLLAVAVAVSLSLSYVATAAAQGASPTQLRRFIDQQVGGIQKLMVPAHDADLPQPRLANGSPDPLFQITEAKRYLGKQLFHDPVRTARIRPEFGGVPATAQTASCASCHMGEAASKAGTLLNFAAGGEGRGYTDAAGNFIPRRRPRTDILPRLRQTLSSPATRWWTSSRRSRTSTSSRWAVQPGVASCRPRAAAANRSTRRPGQRRAQCARRDRRRLQQPPPDGRVRRRARRVARRPQPVRVSSAGKRGAAAARRAPDAGMSSPPNCRSSRPIRSSSGTRFPRRPPRPTRRAT